MTAFECTEMAGERFDARVRWQFAERPFDALRRMVQGQLALHGAAEDDLETPAAWRLVDALCAVSARDAEAMEGDLFSNALMTAAARLDAAFRDGVDMDVFIRDAQRAAERRCGHDA